MIRSGRSVLTTSMSLGLLVALLIVHLSAAAPSATLEMLHDDGSDITNPSVRNRWVGKFNKAEKDHQSHTNLITGYWSKGDSSEGDAGITQSAVTKKKSAATDHKKLTKVQKAQMIARMKVCLPRIGSLPANAPGGVHKCIQCAQCLFISISFSVSISLSLFSFPHLLSLFISNIIFSHHMNPLAPHPSKSV